jgi:glycine/D-amino acid oxidase-like deaminating enzyme
MKLVSGVTPWTEPAPPFVRTEPLSRNVRTEVAVIGAGVAGALIADSLSERGFDVVVLDRREPGAGSTQASRALLQYDLDVPLADLLELLPQARAVRAYQLGVEGIDALEAAADGIDCGFERRRSLYIASEERDAPELHREFEARQAVGLKVSWASQDLLLKQWGVHAASAIVSEDAAQVDPVRLTHGLLERAKTRGARIVEHAAVTEILEYDGVLVRTECGKAIRAKRLVHAGGYEAHSLLPKGSAKLFSTFALESEPVDSDGGAWRDRALLWEFADPYLYARWLGNRVIVGGEDVRHRNDCRNLLEGKCEKLLEKIGRWLPDLKLRVANSWCGPIASSEDGLGFVGPIGDRSPILLALCYGGNGTVHAATAAKMIGDEIEGRKNADADLFRVRRFA